MRAILALIVVAACAGSGGPGVSSGAGGASGAGGSEAAVVGSEVAVVGSEAAAVVSALLSPDQVASRHADRPVVVAHRGASARAPENTLAAYREAIALGARIAETDVHLSADGEVIVMHDATVDRTTGGTGAISELTLEEIRQLEAGSWKGPVFAGEPVPTLAELLDLVRDRLVLCIEVKAGQGIEERILELLRQRDQLDQVLVFSFDAAAVARFEDLEPRIPTVYLAHRPRDEGGGPLPYGTAAVDAAEAAGADALGMDHRQVEPLVVREAQARGLPVFVWTVNEADAVRAMVAAGVDGVISDLPDVAEGVIAGLGG